MKTIRSDLKDVLIPGLGIRRSSSWGLSENCPQIEEAVPCEADMTDQLAPQELAHRIKSLVFFFARRSGRANERVLAKDSCERAAAPLRGCSVLAA